MPSGQSIRQSRPAKSSATACRWATAPARVAAGTLWGLAGSQRCTSRCLVAGTPGPRMSRSGGSSAGPRKGAGTEPGVLRARFVLGATRAQSGHSSVDPRADSGMRAFSAEWPDPSGLGVHVRQRLGFGPTEDFEDPSPPRLVLVREGISFHPPPHHSQRLVNRHRRPR